MKTIIITFIVMACAAVLGFSAPYTNSLKQEVFADRKDGNVRIAIIDVIAPGMDATKRRILTEVFRTEIFKMNLFYIVERGEIGSILEEHKLNLSGIVDDTRIIEIGRFLKTDKLFVCKVGRVFNDITVHFRVIDVATSTIDFAENVFIGNEDQIFDALKEIAKKVEIYYMFQKDSLDSTNAQELMKKKWSMLGASEEELGVLITKNLSPDKYLDVRQYSINFTISNYLQAVKKGWDMDVVKSFLQAGISFGNIEKALGLGIFELNHYKYTFKQAGYTFEDYLTSYENRQVSVEEYSKFKDGYRKDRFVLGIGGVSDSLPVKSAAFYFYGAQVAWEHFWTQYQRGFFKWSMETGLYMINFIFPVPYAEANFYFGSYPFYAKVGIGAHAEVFLGGHAAAFMRFGMEIFERVEWNVTVILTGTQPNVSYNGNFTNRIGTPGYVGISYPYYGAFITYKF